MKTSLGRITVRLADPTETVSANLIDLINQNINPPAPIAKADVYIRAMYVISDEVNSFGGCFPAEEHERLAKLLIDSPVMVGHRKDKLPIARNFHAIVVDRGGRSWVKCYFYWLKSARRADDLRENIDGGIYKECSIGFTFAFPECSVCGKDIRSCAHEPFSKYNLSGREVVCHFNYRRIERVLETSLVYRGALADTSVSKELNPGRNIADLPCSEKIDGPILINDVTQLDTSEKYFVAPYYEGLPILASCCNGIVSLCHESGDPLPQAVCERFSVKGFPKGEPLWGQLVAYRGKERLGVEQLDRNLRGLSGPVSRLELKLMPRKGLDLSKLSDTDSPDRIRLIRHKIVEHQAIDQVARLLMTRDGVRLWPTDNLPPASKGYRYRPIDHTHGVYSLSLTVNGGRSAVLSFTEGKQRHQFVIRQFNHARLLKGGRFIADRREADSLQSFHTDAAKEQGMVIEVKRAMDGCFLTLTGILNGRFALRPVLLDGRRRYLFYRISSQL
ncbi:MAG: hypothetical protein U9R56_01760 [candidate division Zixibacteria bacterium]|nr:hypothetical protein [candidate division Zixibacteria bacterium]